MKGFSRGRGLPLPVIGLEQQRAPLALHWRRRRRPRLLMAVKPRHMGVWRQNTAPSRLIVSNPERRRVNGKPRHKLLTYLGSIHEKPAQGGPEGAVSQDNFWRNVAQRLGRGPNISAARPLGNG